MMLILKSVWDLVLITAEVSQGDLPTSETEVKVLIHNWGVQ